MRRSAASGCNSPERRSVDRTEGISPYSLYGDEGDGALNGGNLPVGDYALTATAYSEGHRGGDKLGTLTVSFTVLDSSAAAEPQDPQSQQPPAAPQNLTAVVNADGSITLSWDAPDDDSVTGYQILRRRPELGEDTLLVYVEDTNGTGTTYTDTGVTAGTRHVYRVKSINAAGVGSWSNYVRVEP